MARFDGICPTCKKPLAGGETMTFSSYKDFINNARMIREEVRHEKVIDTSAWSKCPICGGERIRCVHDGSMVTIWCVSDRGCNWTTRIPILSPEETAAIYWLNFSRNKND